MKRGLLAGRDELRSLRDRIAKRPFDAIYDVLRKRCALILESAPTTERHWRTLWEQGKWASMVVAAAGTQGRMLDLLVAHHIDPNPAYRDRAVEELRNLAAWSTWSDPCHDGTNVELGTAEASAAAVIALDWLWEDLGEKDRASVLDAVRKKAVQPYLADVQAGAWWYGVCHNWNTVVNSGCGLAALALSDEDEDARRAYELARKGLKPVFDSLGKEGGWDEGTGYWGYAMRYLLLLAEAVSRIEDDQSMFHARGMDATGLFPIYFSPCGHAASFGDQPSVPLAGTFYLLAKHFDRPEVTWWLDNYSFHNDVRSTGWSKAGLAMLFRPETRTPKDPKLEPVKVFPQVGWAAMADDWPRPSWYVAAKTGDLSANHSQRDMNSIQLQVDQEMMLVDPGHAPYSREYFSEARGEFYEVQARAHNTITVAESDHRIDARGSIIEARSGRRWRYLACDAGDACGPSVRFIRHLVLAGADDDEMLCVLDELNIGVPEKVDVWWHTRGRIEFDSASLTGTITGRRASIHVAMASTVTLQAWAETHDVGRGEPDRVIHAYAGAVGELFVTGVFSRRAIKPGLEIRQGEAGGLGILAGDRTIDFKPRAGTLTLDGVAGPGCK